jgi:hypothetical protein
MGRIPSVHPIGRWARLVLAKALRGLGSFEVPETKTRRFAGAGGPAARAVLAVLHGEQGRPCRVWFMMSFTAQIVQIWGPA